ncbi:hypothetical protein M752DRAFT_272702, partial [Aspergillus phoenicis ATCC 13157]
MDKQLLLTGSRSAITDRLPLTAYLIAWQFLLTFLFLVAHLFLSIYSVSLTTCIYLAACQATVIVCYQVVYSSLTTTGYSGISAVSCSSRSLNSRIASRRGKTGFRSTVINKNSQLRSSAAILL